MADPDARRGGERLVALYFAAQAAVTAGWWLSLQLAPAVRSAFELDRANHAVLDAFFPADLTVIICGSSLAAVAFARRWPWRRRVAGGVAGGFLYGALFMIGWVLRGGHGALGIPPMVMGTLVSAALAVLRPTEIAT